jgi:hypothetical protein
LIRRTPAAAEKYLEASCVLGVRSGYHLGFNTSARILQLIRYPVGNLGRISRTHEQEECT